MCGFPLMFRKFHVKADSVGYQASWNCRNQRKWNNIHLNQRWISRRWARAGARVVWSSLQRNITVNYIAAVYRGNADCAHRFLLAAQLFTISRGMETGLVWLSSYLMPFKTFIPGDGWLWCRGKWIIDVDAPSGLMHMFYTSIQLNLLWFTGTVGTCFLII